MSDEKEQKKAKRLVHEYRFDKPTHHVALVHSSQGGAASGYTEALVMKSVDDILDADIEKATMVKVTLPFDDFLEKFFNIYSYEAEVLTAILGFKDEEDMSEQEKSDMSWEDYKAECEKEKQDFINSVEILKSVKDGKETIQDLNVASLLSIRSTQAKFETYLEKSKTIGNPVKQSKKETPVDKDEVQKAKDELNTVQTQLAELQKAKEASDSALALALADVQKAKDEVEVMKAEKLANVQATRLAQLEAVKPREEAAELFKSLSPLDDVSFATVIKSFKSSADLEAEALKEKGVAGSQAEEPVDKVAEILKAKYIPKQ
jgi:hypothetical protein